MKKNSILVKSVLMSIITAVTVSFTACTDDADLMNESAEAQVLNSEPKEPVGFIYNDFLTPEDIQILNADTTQISISKELADKKGIDNFVNRPMGIWLNLREASFLRRGTKQTLAGDRYIIDVVKAELAEVLPIGKDITLKTDIYVNPNALVEGATRGGEGKELSQMMEDMSIDEEGCFHPVAIKFDEEMTRGSNMPDVYYSPLELLASGQGQTRGLSDWFEDTWNKVKEFVSDKGDDIKNIFLSTGKRLLDPFGITQTFWDLCIDGNKAGNFTGELLRFKNNLQLKKDIKLGCDVKLYDSAGPYVAAGPQLAADLKLNVRPTEKDPISITSTGKMGIWGEAGAKVEIWKWHIADYYDEFDFGKTKTLWKYPDKNKKQSDVISSLVKILNEHYNNLMKK